MIEAILPALGAAAEGERQARVQASPHHRDGRFRNPVPTASGLKPGTLWPLLKRHLFGKEPRAPRAEVPVVRRRAEDYAAEPVTGLRATWLGHATALLELDGKRVLFDPVLGARTSPLVWIGPKRLHGAPARVEDLPELDAVVISHDHYDHLDMETVKALGRRGVPFLAPLGVGSHLERWGIPAARITELDWWESARVAGLAFTATPARHFSGRGLGDRDRTLWASWAVEGPLRKAFYSGDSGYFDGFKEIGLRQGPFDLTLIQVGAYDPAWPDIHMDPEEAVQAHRDLGGRALLPVHWGSFNLALHAYLEPLERTLAAASATGVKVLVPRPGDWVEPALEGAPETWWKGL